MINSINGIHYEGVAHIQAPNCAFSRALKEKKILICL